MPPDLDDIDLMSPLGSTMPMYEEHVVMRTGVNDWPSRIEADERFPLVKMLKQNLGRGGKFHDPFTNNLLSTSSSPVLSPSILLFPSFRAITNLPATQTSTPNHTAKIDALIRGFLLPASPTRLPQAQFSQSQPATAPEASPASSQLLRDPSAATALDSSDISHLTVLVCGHGQRDSRCGIIGPLLQAQFIQVLARTGWSCNQGGGRAGQAESEAKTAEVELISHIGGHKFAGNVILYIPRTGRWAEHPLSGKGIWYGRVQPKHVEGIVEKTIGQGIIIEELFRGGIGKGKERLRI